jgi:hypothetical protein
VNCTAALALGLLEVAIQVYFKTHSTGCAKPVAIEICKCDQIFTKTNLALVVDLHNTPE